jgi:hypothetical protein
VPPSRDPAVLTLPDGARVRGRGLLRAPSPVEPAIWGLYAGGRRLRGRVGDPPWPHLWLEWPDMWLPRDTGAAVHAIRDAHRRAREGLVEVGCGGGVGRTGTVLACMVVLAGLPPDQAIEWVRRHHHRRAVETPWQRRWVRAFPARVVAAGGDA